MPLIEDSPHRCRRCSKRMVMEIGQEDEHEATIGWVRMVHTCWNCDYQIRDEQIPKPSLTRSGPPLADRLYALRQGVEVPMVYDESPFPKSELDEEVQHVG